MNYGYQGQQQNQPPNSFGVPPSMHNGPPQQMGVSYGAPSAPPMASYAQPPYAQPHTAPVGFVQQPGIYPPVNQGYPAQLSYSTPQIASHTNMGMSHHSPHNSVGYPQGTGFPQNPAYGAGHHGINQSASAAPHYSQAHYHKQKKSKKNKKNKERKSSSSSSSSSDSSSSDDKHKNTCYVYKKKF